MRTSWSWPLAGWMASMLLGGCAPRSEIRSDEVRLGRAPVEDRHAQKERQPVRGREDGQPERQQLQGKDADEQERQPVRGQDTLPEREQLQGKDDLPPELRGQPRKEDWPLLPDQPLDRLRMLQ